MKYARVERERRYLLRELPARIDARRVLEIEDRYVRGTGLRLRLVREPGREAVRKLGQKVRLSGSWPAAVAHTTMYLSEAEYGTLLALPADQLTKLRHLVDVDHAVLAVDRFAGHLDGLVTAEIDLGDGAAAPPLPFGAAREITDDPRFAGGELAAMAAGQVQELLSGCGN